MSIIAFRRLLLFSLTIAQNCNYAAFAHEPEQFSLLLQQFDIIESFAKQAETAGTSEPDDRYRFDYNRLTQDIQRIRQGVQDYLSPSRAQPRAPTELVGDYRLDTPLAEPSP